MALTIIYCAECDIVLAAAPNEFLRAARKSVV